ncbi:SCO family protein [Nitrosospira sp. Nsp13]|uniref:SCO family protein n=1 Tax=Nitrosospira sp. Nsp13 TaxID=1855332 RepID=UPI0008848E69|nr:SCO family protein [Nitrosospira sp. Nsp13]SCY56655.1 protein SCO1/2 [Nitrosospira sp. Nsp13]
MRYRALYAAIVWSAVLVLAACGNTAKPTFLATDITGAEFGKDFKLTDHTGKSRTLADFKGKAVVLFFGYTHCPDICPATMGEIAAALQKLDKDAARVQVLFVTVDPERDTPEQLAQYLSAFSPAFLGLYGDPQSTRDIASEFKIVYQKQMSNSADHHTMDHSSGAYIFDPRGKLRLYVSNGAGRDVFAHDIVELLRTSA